MSEVSEDLKTRVTELVELNKQIKNVRKDLKVLTDREKELKKFVCSYMEDKKIDKVNLRKGKITHKKTIKKPSFTKKTVEKGLMTYFNEDAVTVERVMTCIADVTEQTESSSISLTGLDKD